MKVKNIKNIVLDLDETLIFAKKASRNTSNVSAGAFECCGYRIVKRPFLDEFLDAIHKNFKVGIWSAADEAYVTACISQIIPKNYPLAFIWDQSHCKEKDNLYLKDLSRLKILGYETENLILFDDNPENVLLHDAGSIPVTPFYGDPADDFLKQIIPYTDVIYKHTQSNN